MYALFPQEFTYVIAKTGRKKSDKSTKSQPDTANEVTDDNQEQIYTQIIAANKNKKADNAMPSIVESLYDLTTAIDDTNNDMQQMNNNYEQIPFTRNPSYATKQQSTEVDTSVTEALDTSAVVDTSPQQVVGNESLLDTSDEHIYSKPFKKDNFIETTHNSEDSVVSIGIQNYTQLSFCYETFNYNSHRENNYSTRLCNDIISNGRNIILV